MAEVRYTRRAEEDLLEIGEYTVRTWGAAQALRYLDDLEAACLSLARNPVLGRGCGWIRPGLCRMECGRHVIFYRRQEDGITVSRILHQSMLPERHELGD